MSTALQKVSLQILCVAAVVEASVAGMHGVMMIMTPDHIAVLTHQSLEVCDKEPMVVMMEQYNLHRPPHPVLRRSSAKNRKSLSLVLAGAEVPDVDIDGEGVVDLLQHLDVIRGSSCVCR
jgi:hypothetical protein